MKSQNITCEISIDGGINENNIVDLAHLGAHNFGVASAIFGAPNPLRAFLSLQQLVRNH